MGSFLLTTNEKIMNKIKVVIADDHALVRHGIISLLNKVDELEIVGEASNGIDALAMAKIMLPDVLLMDIRMPEMTGIEALKKLMSAASNTKVILLSMEISEEFISEALEYGVKGYLPKDVDKNVLIDAIKKVHNGEEYFDPRVSEVIFKNYYKKKTSTSTIIVGSGKISAREEEVLTLIGQGKSNQEIADKMYISVRTVDAHRNHIMQKMNLKNTVELIKFGIKAGIIPF